MLGEHCLWMIGGVHCHPYPEAVIHVCRFSFFSSVFTLNPSTCMDNWRVGWRDERNRYNRESDERARDRPRRRDGRNRREVRVTHWDPIWDDRCGWENEDYHEEERRVNDPRIIHVKIPTWRL